AREETEKRLVSQLSPKEQAYWETLGRGQRDFMKTRQLLSWVRDAMDFKTDPQELETFFVADGKLNPDQRQQLLDLPRARMETALERMYYRSELGIENPSQLIGDFGDPGRMPGMGSGFGPPREGEGRPRNFGPGPRSDRGPNDRRPPNRPPRGPDD